MVRRLDDEIRDSSPSTALNLLPLRDRLAGALGAEDGVTSTPELRIRAAKDWAQAARLLGLEDGAFEPPLENARLVVVERDLASTRKVWPATGDGR